MIGLSITRSEEVFSNVAALYTTLVEGRNNLRVRRVELNMNNEVTAEPLDFILDVESKAKKVLSPKHYAMFQYFVMAGEPQLTPLEAKLALGEVWYASDLNLDGSYKTLYFRVKNQQARETMRVKVEDDNGSTEQFD
jgi:hypothetical protein